jgi:hypothetical protein
MSIALRMAGAIYAVLLVACPRAFRTRYGDEMRSVFESRCERTLVQAGRLAWVRCIVSAYVDLVAGGIADRLRTRFPVERQPRGDSMLALFGRDLRVAASSPQHWRARWQWGSAQRRPSLASSTPQS